MLLSITGKPIINISVPHLMCPDYISQYYPWLMCTICAIGTKMVGKKVFVYRLFTSADGPDISGRGVEIL